MKNQMGRNDEDNILSEVCSPFFNVTSNWWGCNDLYQRWRDWM